MSRILPLLLVAFVYTGTADAQPLINVPDLRPYGLATAVPWPAELDGNTATMEFLVHFDGVVFMVNPRKPLIPGTPLLCMESLPNPWANLTANVWILQSVMEFGGTSYLATYGYNMLTGEYPYRLDVLRFETCK